MQHFTYLGQQIVHTVGRIEITLQWVREGAYTVTTIQGGTLRIDTRCSAHADETEARNVARSHALHYKALEVPTLATLATLGQHRETHPTMSGAHLGQPSEAGLTILGTAILCGGTVTRSGAATVTQLRALDRKGLVDLIRNSSRRRVITGARINELGRRVHASLTATTVRNAA